MDPPRGTFLVFVGTFFETQFFSCFGDPFWLPSDHENIAKLYNCHQISHIDLLQKSLENDSENLPILDLNSPIIGA